MLFYIFEAVITLPIWIGKDEFKFLKQREWSEDTGFL